MRGSTIRSPCATASSTSPSSLAEARLGALTLDGSSSPGSRRRTWRSTATSGSATSRSSRTVQLSPALTCTGTCGCAARTWPRGRIRTDALTADHLVVDGSVAFAGISRLSGTVTLAGARVNGAVRLEDATITASGAESVAFDGDGMTVGHDFNAQGLAATGEVRLVDASIASTARTSGRHADQPGRRRAAARPGRDLEQPLLRQRFHGRRGHTGHRRAREGQRLPQRRRTRRPRPASGPAAAPGACRAAPGAHEDRRRFRLLGRFIAHGTIDLTRLSVGGEFRLNTTGLKGHPTAADLTNGRFATLAISGDPPAGFLDLTKAKTDFFSDGAAARWRTAATSSSSTNSSTAPSR